MECSIEVVSIQDDKVWNAFLVGSCEGHLLQSHEWGELKANFGWDVERLAVENGGEIVASAQVLFRKTPLGSMAYIPKGPNLREQEPSVLGELLNGVHSRARRHGAIFLKIEPPEPVAALLPSLGFKDSREAIQPKTTIRVDLSRDLDTISKSLKPKTRYNIGLAVRKGVEIRHASVEDIAGFYELLRETAVRDGFGIHAIEYYKQCLSLLGDKGLLLLAYHQNEIIAGIIVSLFGREAIYLYGASGNSQRNLMPNHLLQWEAIAAAKEAGCSGYDLWGIPDEAYGLEGEALSDDRKGNDELWGVYRFKSGFGGQVLRFPDPCDYVYSKMKYRLWVSAVPRIQSFRRKGAQSQ